MIELLLEARDLPEDADHNVSRALTPTRHSVSA
jgi:hypothetical protein